MYWLTYVYYYVFIIKTLLYFSAEDVGQDQEREDIETTDTGQEGKTYFWYEPFELKLKVCLLKSRTKFCDMYLDKT